VGRTNDVEWKINNLKKIQDLIIEFETFMEERHIYLDKSSVFLVDIIIFKISF